MSALHRATASAAIDLHVSAAVSTDYFIGMTNVYQLR